MELELQGIGGRQWGIVGGEERGRRVADDVRAWGELVFGIVNLGFAEVDLRVGEAVGVGELEAPCAVVAVGDGGGVMAGFCRGSWDEGWGGGGGIDDLGRGEGCCVFLELIG